MWVVTKTAGIGLGFAGDIRLESTRGSPSTTGSSETSFRTIWLRSQCGIRSHEPDLLLRRILLTGSPADAPDVLLCRVVTRGFSAHLALLWSLDEPESLRYPKPVTCLMVADGEQSEAARTLFGDD